MREPQPSVFYNSHGNLLEVRWGDGESEVAEWKNEHLTFLKSVEDREKIIGIIIENFDKFLFSGVRIDLGHDELSLSPEEQEAVNKKIEEVFGAK